MIRPPATAVLQKTERGAQVATRAVDLSCEVRYAEVIIEMATQGEVRSPRWLGARPSKVVRKGGEGERHPQHLQASSHATITKPKSTDCLLISLSSAQSTLSRLMRISQQLTINFSAKN